MNVIKNVNRRGIIYIILFLGLIISGCGGDSASSGIDSSKNPLIPESSQAIITITGRVTVGDKIAGANVCIDKNNNLICDQGEPSAISDSTGTYTLEAVSADYYSFQSIAEIKESSVAVGALAVKAIGSPLTLSSPPGEGSEINALTHMVNHYRELFPGISAKDAESNVKNDLGIFPDINILGQDFLVTSDTTLEIESYDALQRASRVAGEVMMQNVSEIKQGSLTFGLQISKKERNGIMADEMRQELPHAIHRVNQFTTSAGLDVYAVRSSFSRYDSTADSTGERLSDLIHQRHVLSRSTEVDAATVLKQGLYELYSPSTDLYARAYTYKKLNGDKLNSARYEWSNVLLKLVPQLGVAVTVEKILDLENMVWLPFYWGSGDTYISNSDNSITRVNEEKKHVYRLYEIDLSGEKVSSYAFQQGGYAWQGANLTTVFSKGSKAYMTTFKTLSDEYIIPYVQAVDPNCQKLSGIVIPLVNCDSITPLTLDGYTLAGLDSIKLDEVIVASSSPWHGVVTSPTPSFSVAIHGASKKDTSGQAVYYDIKSGNSFQSRWKMKSVGGQQLLYVNHPLGLPVIDLPSETLSGGFSTYVGRTNDIFFVFEGGRIHKGSYVAAGIVRTKRELLFNKVALDSLYSAF